LLRDLRPNPPWRRHWLELALTGSELGSDVWPRADSRTRMLMQFPAPHRDYPFTQSVPQSCMRIAYSFSASKLLSWKGGIFCRFFHDPGGKAHPRLNGRVFVTLPFHRSKGALFLLVLRSFSLRLGAYGRQNLVTPLVDLEFSHCCCSRCSCGLN